MGVDAGVQLTAYGNIKGEGGCSNSRYFRSVREFRVKNVQALIGLVTAPAAEWVAPGGNKASPLGCVGAQAYSPRLELFGL